MKKFFTLVLAVMMIATMSVTAFAAETVTADGGKTEITVNGTYTPADGAGDTVSVVVAWEGMEFTYTEGAAGAWLPDEHKYADDADGSWSTNKGKITVTNHSNVAVTATLAWTQNTALTGTITGTFTESSDTANDNVLALATAVGTEYNAAPSASAEFGISGDAITASGNLGTITVTIAKATN